MEKCSGDLSNHWHLCSLHAVQETFSKVEHSQKVHSWQADKNVLSCVPSDLLFLSKRFQYRFGKEKENEERYEDHRIYDASSVQVYSAEVQLTSAICLSNKSLQRSVHAHYDIKCQAFEYRGSKTKSSQLMCIVELSRINCVNEAS